MTFSPLAREGYGLSYVPVGGPYSLGRVDSPGVIQLRGRKARRAPQLDLEEARRT